MAADIIDTPIIDPNLASYEKFFDHAWCKAVFGAADGTPLADAVASLVVAWRAANGAHILPWLMVESLKRFEEGGLDGSLRRRAGYADALVKAITSSLAARMHRRLKLDQRLALGRELAKIEREVYGAVKAARAEVRFELPGYWDSLVADPEFQFCVLGIQRVNYGSLFFAYEDFLANVIRTREPTYTSKREPIKAAFARHFGDPLADLCWGHDEVDVARLVRHALAHNGGRYGRELDGHATRFVDATGTAAPVLRADRFNVVGGTIQITPDNTRHLFGVLKDRVTKIVEEVARTGPTPADSQSSGSAAEAECRS